MIIQQNCFYNAMYIEDFNNIILYYLQNLSNMSKEYNISYNENYTLYDICNMINSIGKNTVDIIIHNKQILQEQLIIPKKNEEHFKIPMIGMYNGLKLTYNKINII